MKFHYYPADVTVPSPLGEVSLEQFITANKSPKKDVREIFTQIEQAARVGDLKLKDELKSKLYYFTPCVKTDGKGRSYHNITGFNGVMVLDFDKIDNAEEFKQFLFNAVPSIICAYLSPSKKGVKFLVKIPVCKTTDEFKSYFYGISYFLEKYKGFDPSTQNCILPLYLSYDEDLIYRSDATTWTKRGIKLDEFKPHIGEIEVVEDVTDRDRDIVKNRIVRSMEKIVDSAHYIVRSTSLSAGGYCAAGYFSQDEMEDLLNSLIEDNEYCKKNLRGYKQTAREMLLRGMKSPLYV
jgi:hypothetical protein